MSTEMGEFVVGAYLRSKCGCDFVDYNVRPEAGLEGLEGMEIDVVGLDSKNQVVYLCEEITNLDGLLYGAGRPESMATLKRKLERQKRYSANYLGHFRVVHFMLWSPRVEPELVVELGRLEGLELIINGEYGRCVSELKAEARKTASDSGNPFFRALQILERLGPRG